MAIPQGVKPDLFFLADLQAFHDTRFGTIVYDDVV